MVEVLTDKQTVINQVIESQSIDLIAFQPHKHGVFDTLFTHKITKKNFQATKCSLTGIAPLLMHYLRMILFRR